MGSNSEAIDAFLKQKFLSGRDDEAPQDPAQPFTTESKFMMERILIEMGENDGENEHGLLIPTFHTVLVVRREGSSHLISLKLVP